MESTNTTKREFLCMFQYANNANECIFNVAVLRFPSIQFTKEKEKYISIVLVQLLCVSSIKKCNNLSCIKKILIDSKVTIIQLSYSIDIY